MKKDKLRIVDMCIYIDKHIYTDNYDEDLIFKYLKTITKSLAIHKNYFNNIQDYDPFSVIAATRVFLRLINKKQFLPDGDPNKLEKVKSVLNLIKSILYPCKVDYQQLAYNDVIKENFENTKSIYEKIKQELTQEVIDSTRPLLEVEVQQYLRRIKSVVWQVVEETPFKNKKDKYELYTSLLLSLLRALTPSKNNAMRIKLNQDKGMKCYYDVILNKVYEEELQSAPVSWNLDGSITGYIKILLIRVREKIIQDIKELTHYQICGEDFITNVLMYPLKEYKDD